MEIIEQVDQVDAELVRGLYPELRRFAAATAPGFTEEAEEAACDASYVMQVQDALRP